MSKINQYIIFNINDLSFALDVFQVESVISVVEISPLLGANENIMGTINFRGRIIPIVNIRRILNIKNRELELTDKIIIAKVNDSYLGFLIDAVNEIINYHQQPLFTEDNILLDTNYIKGIIKVYNVSTSLINLEGFIKNIKARE